MGPTIGNSVGQEARALFLLRDLPTHEGIHEHADRHHGTEPQAIELWLVLLRVGSDVFVRFEEFLNEHGLSQGRFTVLMLLNCSAAEGLASPSDLSASAGVSRAAMTSIIDGLEKEGLVSREAHPHDRRKLGVRLSADGAALLDRILPGYFRGIAEQMGALTTEEQTQLTKLLFKLRASVLGPDEVDVRDAVTAANGSIGDPS